MSLVEGEERATIPSMSWSSVVGDDRTNPSSDDDVNDVAETPERPSPTTTSTAASVSFQMPSLTDSETTEPAPEPEPAAPPPPPISFTMGAATSTDATAEPAPPEPEPVSLSIPSVSIATDADVTTPTNTAASTAPVVAPTPTPTPSVDPSPAPPEPSGTANTVSTTTSAPTPPAPAAGSTPPDAPPSPAPAPAETQLRDATPVAAPTPSVEREPTELPEIVEATPPESVTRAVAAVHAETPAPVEPAPTPATAASTGAQVVAPPTPPPTPTPTPTPAAPAAAPAPVVAQPPPVAVASLPRTSPTPAVPVAAAPSSDGSSLVRSGAKKDRSTGLARIGFFLLFVAAVVSAGVIFGRPYLFPPEWQDNALPYAEAIEAARGTEFAEPVLLTAQDNPTHRDLVTAQLIGDAQAEMPIWRALGLAGADATDDAALRDLTSGQAPVLYSTSDGQVYYDQSFTQAHRDQLITTAMATAALDQELAFSTDAAERPLDANALTDAHVRQQSMAIGVQATATPITMPEPDVAALAFLPPVLDYRLTAPVVLSDVLAPVNDLGPNPLDGIGVAGPTSGRDTSLVLLSAPSTLESDVAQGDAVAMDRGFWFLVFASHLDAGTAYDLSNSIEQAGLHVVQSVDGRTCAVANFATANAAEDERLAAALTTWSQVVAPELGASVVAQPAAVQLRTCDPGTSFTSNARFGVGRELIGFRATEVAVVAAMNTDGADQATVERALDQIATTPAVQNLVSLPAGTPPSEVAGTARNAATEVLAALAAPAEG